MLHERTESAPGTARAALATLVALVLLTALALGLRLHGIGFLLPQHAEPDGSVIVYQAECLEGRIQDGGAHPYWGYYPQLLARLASCWPASVEATVPSDLAGHLEQARASHLRVRELVACLSVLAVPGTYLLARLFLSRGFALFAAALSALSFLTQWFAQQSRPHAAAASLFLLSVLAAVHARRAASLWAWLQAGAAFGLSLACLQNAVLLAPPLALAWVCAWRERRDRRATSILGAIGVAALAFAAVWLFYPQGGGDAVDPDAPFLSYSWEKNVLLLKGHQVMVGQFTGLGTSVVVNALWQYEPLISSLALVGAFLALRLRWKREPPTTAAPRSHLAIVLSFALPYLALLCLYERTYQRFLIPLVPYLAVLASWALFRAHARWKSQSRLIAVAALILVPQAWLAAKLSILRARPDTLSRAAQWIDEHLEPASARIAVLPGIDVPLAADAESLRKGLEQYPPRGYPWFDYQNAHPQIDAPRWSLFAMPMKSDGDRRAIATDAVSYVLALDAEHVLTEVYELDWRARVLRRVYDALGFAGERVARFAPEAADYHGLPLSYQDDAMPRGVHWAWRTLWAESIGPVVEIHRLQKP